MYQLKYSKRLQLIHRNAHLNDLAVLLRVFIFRKINFIMSMALEYISGKGLVMYSLTLFQLFPSIIKADEYAQLLGRVLNEKNKSPVSGAIILLEPGERYTESDDSGTFEIHNIPEGSYRILIRHVGYQQLESAVINLGIGQIKNINFSLTEEIYTASDAIVITATRSPAISNELSHAMDVVSAERIHNTSPLNASEALQNIQGTFVKDYGGLNAIKTISLRGSSAEQVLVLLNGQRINNPQNGQVDLSTIPLDGIERVEILRGGSSAIYGADAVGGVVNLISGKKETENGFGGSLKLLNGSFNTGSLDAILNLDQNWLSASIGYTRVKSDGDYKYIDPGGNEQLRLNNDITSDNFFSDLSFRLGNSPFRTNLQLNYRYYTSERGSPGPLDFASPMARQWNTNQQLQAAAGGKVFSLLNEYQITAFINRDKYRYEDSDTLFATNTIHNSGLNGFETQFKTVFTSSNELTYGLGFREEWMESNQFTQQHLRNTYYLFIQDEASIKTDLFSVPAVFNVIPAFRYDHYSGFGSQLSPKIGSVLTVGSTFQTALKFNLGWSFRAPTFNELYWPSSAWSTGNKDLKAEKGFDWDIGFNLRNQYLLNFALDIVYFNMRVEDLIQWQSIDFIYMPVNIAKSNNRGIEIKSSIKPVQDVVTLLFNYTYLDARDKSDIGDTKDKYLVYRPRNSFNLAINFHRDFFTIGYDYRYVGKRFTDTINEEYLDPYRVSDITLSLSRKFNSWQPILSLQVKNVFDQSYEVIKYQPMPGRELRVNLGISYN